MSYKLCVIDLVLLYCDRFYDKWLMCLYIVASLLIAYMLSCISSIGRIVLGIIIVLCTLHNSLMIVTRGCILSNTKEYRCQPWVVHACKTGNRIL